MLGSLYSFGRKSSNENITQSMSLKGNYTDNEVMRTFLGRLKVEIFYGCLFFDYIPIKASIRILLYTILHYFQGNNYLNSSLALLEIRTNGKLKSLQSENHRQQALKYVMCFFSSFNFYKPTS